MAANTDTTTTTLEAAVQAEVLNILSIIGALANRYPDVFMYRPVWVALPTTAADVAAHRIVDAGWACFEGRSLDAVCLSIVTPGLVALKALAG